MNVLKDYNISFTGLKNGDHSFDFLIDDKFFHSFENTRIVHSRIQLNIELLKQETMLNFQFYFDGEVDVECDRCLELITHSIQFEEMLLVKFGHETIEEGESILILDEKEHQVELAQYIYEFISLSLPMRLTHPDLENGEPGCDLEYFNEETHDDSLQGDDIDPRWEALKKLKKDN
jgi:uncharacterized metal-binding protein YceD (DUF177 family)